MIIRDDNKLISVLNLIKIFSLVSILIIFFYQQMNSSSLQIIKITRTLLFVFAGLGFSAIISTSILKRGKTLKPFLIILSGLLIIFILLMFNFEKLFTENISDNSKMSIYVILGISFVVLITVFVIKTFIYDKKA